MSIENGRHMTTGKRFIAFAGFFVTQVSAFDVQRPAAFSRRRPRTNGKFYPSDEGRTETATVLESLERRKAVGGILASTLAVSTASLECRPALAGRPEIDTSGQLFSPRPEMLSGGTEATRGVPLRNKEKENLKPGQALQTVYETRFIAYLSRFLLNFDPSAHAWWIDQGFGETWDIDRKDVESSAAEQTFSEFAESVEVGLSDYFVGPYGSYSSLSAAKAGILAAQPAKSVRIEDTSRDAFFKSILFGNTKLPKSDDSVRMAKQGVLNLFTLLKARYNSLAARRQLIILFSFISSPRLQPTDEIKGLLGETDNATITEVTITKPRSQRNEADSRTSPRRGGGYSVGDFPSVRIDVPPALGDEYKQAKLEPVMKLSTRILRIRVVDGGAGYKAAPQVSVSQTGFYRPCQATAILDRNGQVESIILLDPGYGYSAHDGNPPRVTIDAPKFKKSLAVREGKQPRRAKAVADLEYEIAGIEVVEGGNGYVRSEPPTVNISPPKEDPDWFLAVQEQPALRMEPSVLPLTVSASVSEMRFCDGNVAYSTMRSFSTPVSLDDGLRGRLERDPLELLPSTIRPLLLRDRLTQDNVYVIPSVARIPQAVAVLSPRFRAQDPLFGGVGKVPVTKGASSLKTSEYARLALSGAVCTVVVRTALNPLELVKTKQQLQTDIGLLSFARNEIQKAHPLNETGERLKSASDYRDEMLPPLSSPSPSPIPLDETVAVVERTRTSPKQETADVEPQDSSDTIGTLQMLKCMIALRGPKSLFQSADITFLASLVFGSFGFGATELFRRSISSFFLSDSGDQVNEIAVLLAASLATVLTAAAASPFEVLRVRSMALLEEKPWTEVLREFLIEKSDKDLNPDAFDWNELSEVRDWTPLWSGFAPILSRELPFAVVKFLTFDLIATTIISSINAQIGDGAVPVQVGVGPLGLAVSAASGAVAGIAGAFISHPADLILTKTSSRNKGADSSTDVVVDWRDVVKDLISQPGGVANLFVGLPARSTFFFLVIGLQFFLYDYVKSVFQVGSDDLSLVLDVFYAVRAGLSD